MTRLIDLEPQRRIGTSRRALTGRVAIGGSASAAFESSLERDWIEQLDFSPDVVALQVQPFTVEYVLEGRTRRYTPDIAAIWDVGGGLTETVVYEVKPADELRTAWALYRARFGAAVRYCRERSWRFKVINEKHIRGPRLSAVRFLRRYMHIDPDAAVREHLLRCLATVGPTTVNGLLDAAYWSLENRAMAIPYLWRAIADSEIHADLDRPLTMSTPISPRTRA